MPCYGPLTGYYSKEVGKSGKRGLTFDRKASFSGIPIMVPCGQCVGCRLERSRQWAIRCVHEKQMHRDSCFLTLTYDDQHLPYGNTLVVADLQAFCKRLHNRLLRSRGFGIRYYAAGEYGERTQRPHYHLIVYGYSFPDRKFYKKAPNGENLYSSAECEELWPSGFNVIGEVTFDSAAYVARYVVTKLTGRKAGFLSSVCWETGEIVSRIDEFSNMSRRPGIGASWYEKYGAHSYKWDSVIMNGREIRPPRFYDGRYELVDSMHLRRLKSARKRKALRYKADSGSRRSRVKELVKLRTLALFRRDVG